MDVIVEAYCFDFFHSWVGQRFPLVDIIAVNKWFSMFKQLCLLFFILLVPISLCLSLFSTRKLVGKFGILSYLDYYHGCNLFMTNFPSIRKLYVPSQHRRVLLLDWELRLKTVWKLLCIFFSTNFNSINHTTISLSLVLS